MGGSFFRERDDMEYPLIIEGEEHGKLSVERDGLYTLLEAVTALSGEVKRIWVHGKGGEGYLGVMQPWSGGMYLKRKLSRRDMAAFPEEIEYASDVSEPVSTMPEPTPEPEIVPKPEIMAETAPSEEQSVDGSGEETERALTEHGDTPDDALLWFLRPDGSMSAFDGRQSLVALPSRLRTEREGTVVRRINGRDYMIFGY